MPTTQQPSGVKLRAQSGSIRQNHCGSTIKLPSIRSALFTAQCCRVVCGPRFVPREHRFVISLRKTAVLLVPSTQIWDAASDQTTSASLHSLTKPTSWSSGLPEKPPVAHPTIYQHSTQPEDSLPGSQEPSNGH